MPEIPQTSPDAPHGARIDLVVCALLALAAAALVTLGATRADDFSIYDEWTHLDYAYSLSEGRIPAAGSELSPDVRAEMSCRSDDPSFSPECGVVGPASEYILRGENYNFKHPPGYYGVTAGFIKLAEVLRSPGPHLTAARLTGTLWLAAAVVGLYLAVRSWGTSRLLAGSGAVLLLATPPVVGSASIVSNDAPAALCGVAALWVLTRVVRHRRYGWAVPTLLSTLAASTKVMNALGLLVVALAVLGLAVVRLRRGDRRTGAKMLGVTVGVITPIAVIYLGWAFYQSNRGLADWQSPALGINTSPVEGLPLDEWSGTISAIVGLAHGYWLAPAIAGLMATLGYLLSIVYTAAPFMNIAVFAREDPRAIVGWTSLVGPFAAAFVIQATTYIGSGYYFHSLSARYGLTLVPLTITAGVLAAEHRRWRTAPTLVAGGAVLVVGTSFAGIA